MAPRPTKNNLSIRLTESVVFLRGAIESTVTGRRSHREAQPAMLRGLLTLDLVKPTKISSIEIVLEGKSTTAWPEGVGARRLEVTEDHEIFSTKTVFFRAGKEAFGAHARRTASVGPGLVLERDEDDEDDLQLQRGFRGRAGPSGVHHSSDEQLQHNAPSNSEFNGNTPSRRPNGEVDFELEPHTDRYRRMSMDQEFLQRGRSTYPPVSSVSSSPNNLASNGVGASFLDELPSPPYSPRVAPISASSSSTSKTTVQARAIDIPGQSHHRSYSTSHVVSSPSSPTTTIVSPQQTQTHVQTAQQTLQQSLQLQLQSHAHSLSHRAPGTHESWMSSCSIASESTIFEEGEGAVQQQQRSEEKGEGEGSNASAGANANVSEGNNGSEAISGLDASDNAHAGSGNVDEIGAASVAVDQQATNRRPALHTSVSHNTISTLGSDDSGPRDGHSSGSSNSSMGSQNSNPDLSPLSLSRHTSSDGHQNIASVNELNGVTSNGQVVEALNSVAQAQPVLTKSATQVQIPPSQTQNPTQQNQSSGQTHREETRNDTISPSRGRARFPSIDTSVANTSTGSQISNGYAGFNYNGNSNSSVAGSIAASISQLFGHHGRSSRSSTPTGTPPASHTPSRTPSRAPSRTPSRARLSTLVTQVSQASQVPLPPSVPVSPATSTTFHTPPPSAISSSTHNIGMSTEGGSNLSSPSHLSHPNSFSTPSQQQQQSSPSVHMKARSRDESRGAASERGRRYGRFSLAMVSTALFDTVKERLRSSSPNAHGGVSRERVGRRNASPDRRRDLSEDRETERGRSRAARARVGDEDELYIGGVGAGGEHVTVKEHHKEKSTLERLGEVLGLDGDDNGSGDGWKEFRKGTYTYPISFAIPANSPPTLQCDFGSVSYRLKATVHRPGTFTTRLTATRDVTLIACPGEDDLDESDNIVVQREWDSQMHYLIIVSGRAFPIGSSIPLQITFMPIAKIKVYRISAYIEERVDYYTQFKRVARSDNIKKFELLSIRYPEKDPPALLPLTTDYSYSPLRGYIDVADESEAASEIMGPGPWTIQAQLQLPRSCARMHFTNKHKKSNIGINHTLKIVMRVERGDDHYLDSKTGRRKNFDIVVQTPIHILSCRCNPEWTSLPRYSSFATETHSKTQTCPCTSKRPGSTVTVDEVDPAMDLALHNPLGSSNIAGPSRPTRIRAAASEPHHTPYPPPLGNTLNGHDAFSPGPSFTGSGGEGGHYLDGVNLSLSRQNSLTPSETDSVFRRGSLFARLVAGEESEQGEAPPRYDCIPETRHFMSAGASAEVVPAPHR